MPESGVLLKQKRSEAIFSDFVLEILYIDLLQTCCALSHVSLDSSMINGIQQNNTQCKHRNLIHITVKKFKSIGYQRLCPQIKILVTQLKMEKNQNIKFLVIYHVGRIACSGGIMLSPCSFRYVCPPCCSSWYLSRASASPAPAARAGHRPATMAVYQYVFRAGESITVPKWTRLWNSLQSGQVQSNERRLFSFKYMCGVLNEHLLRLEIWITGHSRL